MFMDLPYLDIMSVYDILKNKHVKHLYHANTVLTSCTFLQKKGLASRRYIEDHKLQQTQQPSDSTDKKYGIWNDIFMDTVDIHKRASKRNFYGPVLFIFPINILIKNPEICVLFITKKNPIHWVENEPLSNRFFMTIDDLKNNGFELGTFGQMILIRTKDGILSFIDKSVNIFLDDPLRILQNGKDTYELANNRLKKESEKEGIDILLRKRKCVCSCKCTEEYSKLNNIKLNKLYL